MVFLCPEGLATKQRGPGLEFLPAQAEDARATGYDMAHRGLREERVARPVG